MGSIIQNGIPYAGSYEKASSIGYTPLTEKLISTNVQDALDELSSQIPTEQEKIIYIDNQFGNDSNDGSTVDNALKTFSAADAIRSSLYQNVCFKLCSDYDGEIGIKGYTNLKIESANHDAPCTINGSVAIYGCTYVEFSYFNIVSVNQFGIKFVSSNGTIDSCNISVAKGIGYGFLALYGGSIKFTNTTIDGANFGCYTAFGAIALLCNSTKIINSGSYSITGYNGGIIMTGSAMIASCTSNGSVLSPIPESNPGLYIIDGKIRNDSMNVITFKNIFVSASSFASDTSFPDYPYRTSISCAGVTADHSADVRLNSAQIDSGIFYSLTTTGNSVIYLYSSSLPESDFTIPAIICTKI